jgi:hypothetical protein
MPNSLVKRKERDLATDVGCPRNLGMRVCAWLTGIDQHALHTSTASKLGSLAKPYLRWSLQSPEALTFLSLEGFCWKNQYGFHTMVDRQPCMSCDTSRCDAVGCIDKSTCLCIPQRI